VVCVLIWLPLAAETVRRAINGKMFFAPCLGTDLYLKKKLADEEKVGRP
jgi:hypothetical protein